MICTVSITRDNILSYPMHSHADWEVMCYISGDGYMMFDNNKIAFSPGTLIAVPPCVKHGSVSKNGFKNISIGWCFGKYLNETKPFSLLDNKNENGRKLATMIFENQYADNEFLRSLLTSYAMFIVNGINTASGVKCAIENICEKIHLNYCDPDFKTEELLYDSGYTPDYIRNQFKIVTGKTPIEFLNYARIDHAKKLIDIYTKRIPLKRIAYMCGFSDEFYFSRCFKKVTGLSPSEYLEKNI